jgi:hypothetical protein
MCNSVGHGTSQGSYLCVSEGRIKGYVDLHLKPLTYEMLEIVLCLLKYHAMKMYVKEWKHITLNVETRCRR